MKDKIVLITGSTDGIGKQTAIELAKMGARVLIHGRNEARGKATLVEIARRTGNKNIELYLADFSSLEQVRNMAAEIITHQDRLDVLVNNAGVYMKQRKMSADNFEMTFAVNHLAPFLLTNLLLDLLKASAPSRIITVSSRAHESGEFDLNNLQGEKRYHGHNAYAISKTANILFTLELAERLGSSGVTANCLNPGTIGTKMLRSGWGISGNSLEEGAETPVYLASSQEVESINGKYFSKKYIVPPTPLAQDKELRKEFWKVSEILSGLEDAGR